MRNSPVEELFQNISTGTDIVFNIIENLYQKNSCEILLTKIKIQERDKIVKVKITLPKKTEKTTLRSKNVLSYLEEKVKVKS